MSIIFPDQFVKQTVVPEMLQHCTYTVPITERTVRNTITIYYLPTHQFIYSIIGRAQLLQE